MTVQNNLSSYLSNEDKLILEKNKSRREKLISSYVDTLEDGDKLPVGELRVIIEAMTSLDTLILKSGELELKHAKNESDDNFKANAIAFIKANAVARASANKVKQPAIDIPTDIVTGEAQIEPNQFNVADFIRVKEDKDA